MADLDRHFISLGIDGSFPLIHKVLEYLPIPAVQQLIQASANIKEVGGDYSRKRFKMIAEHHTVWEKSLL